MTKGSDQRTCINIHNGTPGTITEVEGEVCVLYKDPQGNTRKTLYSPLTWQEKIAPPKVFPKSLILQVAYEADRKLAQIHGVKQKEWLNLSPEERRAWLDEAVDLAECGAELGFFRAKVFRAILDVLEPLWKEA